MIMQKFFPGTYDKHDNTKKYHNHKFASDLETQRRLQVQKLASDPWSLDGGCFFVDIYQLACSA
jgi:hypothetical protein